VVIGQFVGVVVNTVTKRTCIFGAVAKPKSEVFMMDVVVVGSCNTDLLRSLNSFQM